MSITLSPTLPVARSCARTWLAAKVRSGPTVFYVWEDAGRV